jgi:hypothetical protein
MCPRKQRAKSKPKYNLLNTMWRSQKTNVALAKTSVEWPSLFDPVILASRRDFNPLIFRPKLNSGSEQQVLAGFYRQGIEALCMEFYSIEF